MSKARAKGSLWETELLPTMKHLFGEHVERAPLRGISDHGDFVNIPAPVCLVEAKNHLSPHFQEWARVCEKKDQNWTIIWKGDRRKGSGQGPYCMMPLHLFEQLVEAAK